MKAGLLFLPFFALLVAAVGTAAGSAMPDAKWIAQAAWALGVGIVVLWLVLDISNVKAAFSRKGAKYGASSGLIVLLGFGLIVALALLTSRPRFNKSIDLTRDSLNTLSDQSLKLVEQSKTSATAGQPIKLTAFMSDDAAAQQVKDLVALYQAAGAAFAVEYVDPNVNPTRAIAAKVEGNALILEYGKQEKRITTFNEEKLSNALVNVLKDKSKKIYFTKGHGEGALRGTEETGFGTVVTELEGNKYVVEELSLLESVRVPEDADLVVIAGPKYDFKEEETRVLDAYMKSGGAVLTMVNSMTPSATLGRLMETYGVKYSDDLLILSPDDPRAEHVGQNVAFITNFDDFSPVTKDFASQSQVALALRFTRSIAEIAENPNLMKVNLVAKTSKEVIKVRDVRQPSDLEGLTQERWELGEWPVVAVATGKTQSPSTAANDKKGGDTATDAAAATGSTADSQKEIRLVAVGSADFASNAGAQLAEHRDMFMNMTSYLLQDEDFISIRPKDATKSTLDMSSTRSQLALLLLAFVYPFFFLGAGTFAWLKRRRA